METREFKIRCSQIGKIMSNAKVKGELSQTCKTYLHEWYANDNEKIYSKYMDKGIAVEDDLIDFMAVQLGYGVAEKCRESRSNEWLEGSCDVLTHDAVVETKASWNNKTLHQQVIDGIDKDYDWQTVGYMHLYNRTKGILFFGLMNTPETDWAAEISFDDLDTNQRWLAYNIEYSEEKVQAIKERVYKCREYLKEYDTLIKSNLGKLLS